MIEDVREFNPLNGILNSAFPELRSLTSIIMESIKSLAGREIDFGILYTPELTRERISSSLLPLNERRRPEGDTMKGGFPQRSANRMHPRLQMSLDVPDGSCSISSGEM